MGMITSIRAPILAGEAPAPVASADLRNTPAARPNTAQPVAETMLSPAAQQPAANTGAAVPRLLAANPAKETSAAAAAEAARAAYIKASIAAGISPLPLP
ncbi:MAG: hypothetical protein JNK34_08250 [Tabrizicola sp.]|nr:hypothetical protein [Tabrizicola sp.]